MDYLKREYERIAKGGEIEWEAAQKLVPLGAEAQILFDENNLAFRTGFEYGYMTALKLADRLIHTLELLKDLDYD